MSQAKHWCEYCKIFISGSKASITFHENGRKHKEIVELFMRDMRKRGRDRRADEKELSREMEKIEREAMKQYMKEDARGPRADAGGASGGGPASASATAPSGGGADRALRMAELEAKIKAAKGLPSGTAGPPPPGWRVQANPDGRFYYVHQSTGETRWDNPSSLSTPVDQPAAESTAGAACSHAQVAATGWQCGYSAEGVPYFYHVSCGITQWEAPPEWVAEHGDMGTGSGSASAAAACSCTVASDATAAPDAQQAGADAAAAEEAAAAEVAAAQGPSAQGKAGPADDLEPEPVAVALTESAAVDEATGLGQWTVVEPSQVVSSQQKRLMKRPRGFEVHKGDDEESAHDVVAHVRSHYAVPEVIRKAAEAEDPPEEGLPPAEAVVFKKRTKSRAGFRNSKTA